MEFSNAITQEGYLEKQNPSIFKMYKRRYFAIRGEGEFLVWYKVKPFTIQQNPKGILKIIEMKEINPDSSDQKIFTAVYGDRKFVFRAESQLSRQRWIDTLLSIKDYLRKTIKKSIINPNSEKWKWQQLDKELAKKVRIQNQKLFRTQVQDNSQEISHNFLCKILQTNNIKYDIEKNIVHGYFVKKGIIHTEQKWFCIINQFNLQDEKDQNMNQRMRYLLDDLNSKDKKDKSKKNKKKDSDSDSSSENNFQLKEQEKMFQINTLYIYNKQTHQREQKIELVDVIQMKENSLEKPYNLKLKYVELKQGKNDWQQEQKQLIMNTNYLSEIQHWKKSIEIIFEQYSLKKIRQKSIEERFMKFSVKSWKKGDFEDWRKMIDGEGQEQYVYLNYNVMKIAGHIFQLKYFDRDQINSEKIKIQEGQETIKTSYIKIKTIKKEEIDLIFADNDQEKAFKKKLKKILKKLEKTNSVKQQIQISKMKSLPIEKQSEKNLNTYMLDKRLRQTQSQIKINFYELMEKDADVCKIKKKPKQPSFFDKVVAMFCGQPQQDDLMY